MSLRSRPSGSEVIAMTFNTWHDSSAVMECVTSCSDMVPYNWITLKLMFYQIWITTKKLVVKWARSSRSNTFSKCDVTVWIMCKIFLHIWKTRCPHICFCINGDSPIDAKYAPPTGFETCYDQNLLHHIGAIGLHKLNTRVSNTMIWLLVLAKICTRFAVSIFLLQEIYDDISADKISHVS